jgi:hypothetical protein
MSSRWIFERTGATGARGQTTLDLGARLSRASKLRGRRGRKASEETAGQAAAIVDHDAPADNAGLVQNHGVYIARDFGSAIPVWAAFIARRASAEAIQPFRDSGLLRGVYHRAALRADPLARNDATKKRGACAPRFFVTTVPEKTTRRRRRGGPACPASRRCGPTCRAGCAGNTALRGAPCRGAPP